MHLFRSFNVLPRAPWKSWQNFDLSKHLPIVQILQNRFLLWFIFNTNKPCRRPFRVFCANFEYLKSIGSTNESIYQIAIKSFSNFWPSTGPSDHLNAHGRRHLKQFSRYIPFFRESALSPSLPWNKRGTWIAVRMLLKLKCVCDQFKRHWMARGSRRCYYILRHGLLAGLQFLNKTKRKRNYRHKLAPFCCENVNVQILSSVSFFMLDTISTQIMSFISFHFILFQWQILNKRKILIGTEKIRYSHSRMIKYTETRYAHQTAATCFVLFQFSPVIKKCMVVSRSSTRWERQRYRPV